MGRNNFIVFSLFLAYLLVLAHAVIPHHHHSSVKEADNHHKHEHSIHYHPEEHNHGHEHTTHFVHMEDFDNYIAVQTLKLKGKSRLSSDTFYVLPETLKLQLTLFIEEYSVRQSDLPPPIIRITAIPNGLRGSPVFIFQS